MTSYIQAPRARAGRPKPAKPKRRILPLLLPALLLACRLLTRTYYLRTGSMSPSWPEGSLIVTTTLLSPGEGSVCAYRRGDMTVIHRVVGITEEGFIFKGDANNKEDPFVILPSQIEGTMILGIPNVLAAFP